MVPLDLYLNIVVGGILTGLVYGLMALGLSVIFGVVRVVDFAHGEMMTIAMSHGGRTLATAIRARYPDTATFLLLRRCSCLAMCCMRGLIDSFITRPEHSQFLLLVALAIIIANVLLILSAPTRGQCKRPTGSKASVRSADRRRR